MANKDELLANIILNNIGEKENIIKITHCITRLRFTLKDDQLPNKKILESTHGIESVFAKNGQYQIVIRNNVAEVYHIIKKIIL